MHLQDGLICLLSTRNHAFAKIIAQIIKLKAQYPEHRIQSIRMDMLLNLHHVLLMITVRRLVFKFNTRSHMSILKMV